MKRSEAARFARLSALLAFALAATTGGIYLHRKWVAHVEKKNAPPAPSANVERQSSGLTFSKVEGDRTIFTVHASKSTDFRGQDASLLEDVRVTVFGKKGERNDVLHTQSCQFAKADGSIQCSGDVQIDLQSAADVSRSEKEGSPVGVIRVETSGVTFEKATGRAQTVKAVKFSFPNGEGKGIGAVYSTDDGELRLVREVELNLDANSANRSRKASAEPNVVTVKGSSLKFSKEPRTIVLDGPVTGNTTTQQLKAGELTVKLDSAFRGQSLVATEGPGKETPELSMRTASGTSVLQAATLTSLFAPEGWIKGIKAEGNMRGSSPEGGMSAENGELEMYPRVNQPKLLTLRGNVQMDTHDAKSGATRTLKSNALQIDFAGSAPGKPSRIRHAETLGHGAMEWTDAVGTRSKLDGEKLAVDFGAKGKAVQLVATGGAQTERESKGNPVQRASASSGIAEMGAGGDWSKITLHGGVRIRQGERSAESEEAVLARASQTAVLTGKAIVRDTASETHAEKISLKQASGEILAEGNVHSTDLSANSGTVQLSAVPANISADRLDANSKTGRAVYSGHARLWQGPSVLEADSIELRRETRELHAVGNVRGVFPQAAASSSGNAKKTATLWHVSSGTLTYWDAENRARLEKNVAVQSVDQNIRASALDLFFTRSGDGKTGSTSQISRALGTGGVVVEEGVRRGVADRGVYTADEQKFVLSGGNPTLYDAAEGATTGRELTFYIASDTIIVDSGNGLRTLTKHRVQR